MFFAPRGTRLQGLVDIVAAGFFAAATAVSAAQLGSPFIATSTGILAFGGVLFALSRVDDEAVFRLPEFALGPFERSRAEDFPKLLLTDMSELLLTDPVAPNVEDGELLLEERLPRLERKSHVIQLFDPRTVPTAGDLHQGIEPHRRAFDPAYPDATAELHSALTALKNSLR